MTSECEEWRPIAGCPLYEVSDLGRVRSRARGKVMILKPSPRRSRRGGPVTHYAVNIGGKVRRIHALVLGAFVGPCPEGLEGCHSDGDPANNRLGNLRWDTHRANHDDAVRHGRFVAPPVIAGEAHHNATLSDAQIVEIRALDVRRGQYSEIGKRYGVSHQTIRRITLGKTRTAWPRAASA